MPRPDEQTRSRCTGYACALTRRDLLASGLTGVGALLCGEALADPARRASDAAGLLIHADLIHTVSGPDIKNGVILIRGGRIAAVGQNLTIPAGIKTIRASVVMPAMVDPHSYLGCYYENSEPVDAVTPDFRIADGFEPSDEEISRSVRAGVTTAAIMPGNGSVLGGQAAVLRLGASADIIARTAGQKISATEDAANAERNPTSRAGALALLRAALTEAASGRAVSSTSQTTLLVGYPSSLSERVEALKPLLQGRQRAFFHTPTADDIDNVTPLIDAFKLKAVLVHASEGYVAAQQIVQRKLPAVLSSLHMNDSDHTLANAARLHAAGIAVSFCTDSPLAPPESLRLSAHIAAHYGLPALAAIRALTLSGAEAIGVSHLVGSLEAGKEADLLLLSGEPLDLTSRIEGVIMRGRVMA